jgi:hypothetical protein
MTNEREKRSMTTDQAIARLRAWRDLVDAIAASGQGIYYWSSESDWLLLQGYEAVVNAAASRRDGEGWFDEIRRHAGLAPSSSGLLSGVLHRWYASHISPEAQIEHLKRALARKWGRPEPDE